MREATIDELLERIEKLEAEIDHRFEMYSKLDDINIQLNEKIAVMGSRASQFESTITATVKHSEDSDKEAERLRKLVVDLKDYKDFVEKGFDEYAKWTNDQAQEIKRLKGQLSKCKEQRSIGMTNMSHEESIKYFDAELEAII